MRIATFLAVIGFALAATGNRVASACGLYLHNATVVDIDHKADGCLVTVEYLRGDLKQTGRLTLQFSTDQKMLTLPFNLASAKKEPWPLRLLEAKLNGAEVKKPALALGDVVQISVGDGFSIRVLRGEQAKQGNSLCSLE